MKANLDLIGRRNGLGGPDCFIRILETCVSNQDGVYIESYDMEGQRQTRSVKKFT